MASETDFQRTVIEAAQRFGWMVFHARKAQNARGDWRTPVAGDGRGFCDLVLARRGRIIFAELKRDGGYPTPDQRKWLEVLGTASGDNVLVVVWKPADWSEIEDSLRR